MNEVKKIAATIVVSGLVQGVGFRYFVHSRASKLGVTGFVRNLYSGEVEIQAEGEKTVLEILIEQVRTGPRSAMVRDVTIQWKEPSAAFTQFEIR